LGKILETLAVVEAEGKLPIWALVSTHVNRLGRGTTVVIISPETDSYLLTIAMDLIHRGLVPVIVLIDPSGFGGAQGSEELSQKLLALGVFTFVINEGDDIKEILETSQTIVIRHGFLRVGVENR
jgi:cellobiose-specific phosphotransferase system component IIB